MAVILDKLQQLLPKAFANLQFWAGKHLAVFLQDVTGYIQTGRFGNGKQQHGALQAGWLDGSGNQYIGVDYQTERKHYRFGFCEREALMILSIRREVSALVPFFSASSPRTLKTSGSGAASLT